MPIIVVFHGPQFTQQKYKRVGATNHRRQAAGIAGRLAGARVGGPRGRQGPNGFRVVDVWESEDAFRRFGEKLIPILEVGRDRGQARDLSGAHVRVRVSGSVRIDRFTEHEERTGESRRPRAPFHRLSGSAIAWIDRLIRTSSPTRKPPVSSAAFHVRPKSFRLSVRLASKPARTLPHGSLAVPRYVTGIVISLATPRIVNVPTTS